MFEDFYAIEGQIPHIRALCAELNENASIEAERKYIRYLELTWRIFEEAHAADSRKS